MLVFLEYPGVEAHAVLTGVMSHAGLTKNNMKCANNYKQQRQKKKRKHDSSNQNGRGANHLTTSTMVAKHLDWIKQVAIKGSCDSDDVGTISLSNLIFYLISFTCFIIRWIFHRNNFISRHFITGTLSPFEDIIFDPIVNFKAGSSNLVFVVHSTVSITSFIKIQIDLFSKLIKRFEVSIFILLRFGKIH